MDLLLRRVSALEKRLERVEAAIGLQPVEEPATVLPAVSAGPAVEPAVSVATPTAPLAGAEAISPTPAVSPERPVTPPPLPPRPVAAEPVEPLPAIPVTQRTAPDSPTASPSVIAPPSSDPSPAPRRVVGYARIPKPKPAALDEGEWEQTIGLKWAGWVGAITLVIGAVLGIRYGYEMWFRYTPPELRFGAMTLFAMALIAAGEWVYRRIHVWSAAGLFGAGIALLFACAYTGHGVFDLYSRDTAFVVMGIATIIGAAVAVRGRLVSIAMLALLGGGMAPMILGGDSSRLVAFLAYLLMLQVVALVLAWWGRDRRWWTIRLVSLATTSLWMLPIFLRPGLSAVMPGPPRPYDLAAAPLIFSILFALLYQAELIFSSLRRDRADDTDANAGVFSTLVTALLLGATLVALQDHRPLVRGGWVIAYAAITFAAGFALARRSARTLSLALRIQAAALVIVAVPVALSGAAVPIAWAILAVVFAVLAWLRDSQIARIAAVVTWIGAMLTGCLQPAVALQTHVALMAGVVAAGHIVAWLTTAPRQVTQAATDPAATAAASRSAPRPWALSAFASACWLVTAIQCFEPVHATVAILIYAWLLTLADVPAGRLQLALQALGLVAVAAGKWALVDLLAQRMGQGWTSAQLGYVPIANPLMLVGAAVAASMIAIWFLRRRRFEAAFGLAAGQPRRQRVFITLASLVIAVLALGLTLEIDRVIEQAVAGGWTAIWRPEHVQYLCSTMLWTLAAMVLGGIIWRISPDPQRRSDRMAKLAWAPFLLTGKFVLIDTLHQRTRSFIPGVMIGNLEFLTAVVLLASLALVFFAMRGRSEQVTRRPAMMHIIAFTGLLLMLFAGSLEVARVTTGQFAFHVGLSVWWSMFALATIIFGFAARASALRYFGLGLFAVTIAKVFFVDLSHLGTGWRTLSFICLGLLLLGTSVLYGRFSPKLLNARKAP